MNPTTRLALIIGTGSLAVLLTGFLPMSVPVVSAGTGPAVTSLAGTVRDFRSTHPDFDVTPDGGIGHYAGNVNLALASGHPVFAAPGIDSAPGAMSDTHLVAYWNFNDGSGTTANDAKDGNDGTLSGGTAWVTGYEGTALQFDGTNDYVEIPSSPEVQVTGDVTFAGRFKLDADFDGSSPATFVVMEKFLDTDRNFHIALAGGDYNRPEVPKGALVFKTENGPTSDYYRYKWTNRTNWTAGVWYHFAAVLNSSDTAQSAILIDGVDHTSATDAGGVGFIDAAFDAPMRIGGKTIDYNGAATDIHFKGAIDDVMIFRRVVTESDFGSGGINGFKVSSEWRERHGYPIAPHLYVDGVEDLFGLGPGDEVPLVHAPSLSGTRNTWDSSVGPYGGANRGPAPTFTTGNTMPTLSEPTNVPASEGDFQIAGSVTIDSNRHFNDLRIVGGSKTLQISGNVTILVDGNLHLEDECRFDFLPGATLDLYVKGWVLVLDGASFNMNTWDPSRLRIYMLGNYGSGGTLQPGLFKLEDFGRVCATIIAPQGKLLIREEGHVYGAYMGEYFTSRAESGFHRDTGLSFGSPGIDACGVAISDTAGAAGANGTGGITSTGTFHEWYADIMGTNLSRAHTIDLISDGTGVYEYLNDGFYPIDDALLGNEDLAHNYLFTYAIRASFTYSACNDQFFEFEGSDDAWLFVDGRLAMDLGGVIPGTEQYVPLDRLGLVDGETYELHFFYAQRQTMQSEFRLRTNLELTQSHAQILASGGFD